LGKASRENLKEKFAGLYEENKFSSLFTASAALEFEKGNLTNAAEILKNGLKIYPDYPTAFVLLGKVYLELKEYENAEDCFRKGYNLVSSKESFNYYITEIEKRKRRESLKQTSDQEFNKNSGEKIKDSEIIPQIEDFNAGGLSNDDELDELVRKIDNARIDFANSDDIPIVIQPEDPLKGNGIVSETLAKIYLSQGKFKEAIVVYEKLQQKQPDKSEYYTARINEIQSQIEGMDW
jgi:tetratricopeptide (TPR) repeat protein